MKAPTVAFVLAVMSIPAAAQVDATAACDLAAAIDRLTAAVERSLETERAALLLERVRLGSAAGTSAEQDFRDARERKQAIEDEIAELDVQEAMLDERLTTATDPAAAAEFRQVRDHLRRRADELRKNLEQAAGRVALAEAEVDKGRRELEEWLRYIDRILARE
ncbi:MAG: hypothetical protein ACRD2J_05760 [Thermoanaerobaculia bacterium]